MTDALAPARKEQSRIRGQVDDGSAAAIVGVAAYRHTHNIDGVAVGMIGVSLTGKSDALKIGGRTVKNRSYRADELTVVVE
jgi:hypothetical protein